MQKTKNVKSSHKIKQQHEENKNLLTTLKSLNMTKWGGDLI